MIEKMFQKLGSLGYLCYPELYMGCMWVIHGGSLTRFLLVIAVIHRGWLGRPQ